MNRFLSLTAFILTLLLASCEKDSQGGRSEIDVQLEIPSTITLGEGEKECSFRIMFGKAPLATDKIVFETAGGKDIVCSIKVDAKRVTVYLTDKIVSGQYKLHLKRQDSKKFLKEVAVFFQSAGMELDEATTVYGCITCGEEPLQGVVVSDGIEVTETDDKGMYQLKSEKYHGYVFVSVPGGYEAKAEGVFPQLYKLLSEPAKNREKIDFDLVKVENQDNYKVLFFGDMHLANRNNDMRQFSKFIDEINDYAAAGAGQKIYGVTIGDMTWDLYWVTNAFNLSNYVSEINDIKGMQIFHTVGNHDHEMKAVGDYDTVIKFKETIAPTYYSFNIGKVHYVILDDIDCTNDGTGSRTYVTQIVDNQVEWLKKDLQYVSKDTPLILVMHAPLRDTRNKTEITNLISSYSNVHVVSGHTHKVTNYINSGYMEHVSGAVCADWWWSGKNVPDCLVSTDGAPGGYAVWDVKGTDFKWRYKATGKPEDYQFRSYDLNNVTFVRDELSGASEDNLNSYAAAYPRNSKNEVLINVWNWNDRWKISVEDENGNVLRTSHKSAYDPLHIAVRYAWNSTTENFSTQKNGDFFSVTAADADVDLVITVEDEFGNVYTEKMQRPKTFSAETYK